jgi:hypothetical protein
MNHTRHTTKGFDDSLSGWLLKPCDATVPVYGVPDYRHEVSKTRSRAGVMQLL